MIHDPVCGKRINANKAYAKIKYGKDTYYVCCPICQSMFEAEPEKYISVAGGRQRKTR